MNLRTLSTSLLALTLVAAPAWAQSSDADVTLAKAQEAARMKVIAKVSQAFVAIGGGSGVIISADGLILTNHHVAGSRPVGSTWIVTRPGGVFVRAKILGTDPRGDITLLKLVKSGPYPYVKLGDSDAIQVGQAVIALGNPFGFSKDGTPNVTVGLISATHRYQGGYSDAIQTDAAINPGNSGGPLIDFQGRLLGINGRIAVRFGTRSNTGIGYAIPTNQIKAFMPQLMKGKVGHGVVRGLSMEDTPAGGTGALVRRVRSGSGAAAAGFRNGDKIVRAGGRAVHNSRRFEGIVGTYPAGDSINVVVKRDGGEVALQVTLEARDRSSRSSAGRNRTGGYLGVRLSSPERGGAEVEEVVAGSPAARSGLQTGDVIRQFDGTNVKNVPHLIKLLTKSKVNQTIKLSVLRNGTLETVRVRLGKKPAR
ncbi:MAG: PDZ domain-containing protein [Planctomycetes bacterium]|nr:PDZ domain-containing protein [Planctomycetota bacterium]